MSTIPIPGATLRRSHLVFGVLAMLGATAGAIPAQSLCFPTPIGQAIYDSWFFNVDVAHPGGITVTSIDIEQSIETTTWSLYLRAGGATFEDRTNAAAWTLVDTQTLTSSEDGSRYATVRYQFGLALSEGLTGIALVNDGSIGTRRSQPLRTAANSDLTMTSLGAARDAFGGTLHSDRTIAACLNYLPHSALDVQARLDGAAVAPHVAISPDDATGNGDGVPEFVRTYRAGASVALTADPALSGLDVFDRWFVDGVAQDPGNTMTLTMGFDHTAVAQYETVTCYEPELGTHLSVGDHGSASGIDLGFDFPVPGGGTTRTVEVCSEGYLWLEQPGGIDPTPSVSELRSDPARIAAFWTDLEYSNGGDGVYVNTFPGRAVITWNRARAVGSDGLLTAQLQMFESGRIMFGYSGRFPTGGAAYVGWSPGNNEALAAAEDLSSSWDSGSEPLVVQPFDALFGSFDLQGRVVTALPNGSGGYLGHTLESACEIATAVIYGSGCPTPSAFHDLGSATDLRDRSFTLSPNAAGGYDVAECASSCYDPALGTGYTLADDRLWIVGLPFAFPYPGNVAGSTIVGMSTNGFVWLEDDPNAQPEPTPYLPGFESGPARLAPFWVDLDPSSSLSDATYVKLEPARAVLTWHDIVEFGRSTPLTVQCVLAADGTVTFSYVGDVTTNGDVLVGFTPGPAAGSSTPIDIATATPFLTSAPGYASLGLDVGGYAPVLGQTVDLELSNVPTGSLAGALFFGFSPLSVDLGILGAPGCLLLTSVDVAVSFGLAGSTPALGLTVPPATTLVGIVVNVQAATISPGVNALGVATSNGLALTIGEF